MATSHSSWNMFSSCSLTTTLLVLLPLGIFGYVFSGLASLFMRQARSPLRHLRGPPAPSLFLGNLSEMHEGENDGLLQRWEDTYGPVLVYRGFVGGRRLMTFDPRAVAHILGNAYDYPKPDFIRDSLATMATGYDGLIVAEGEQHRRLRRILNPAFASSHIKSLAPIFWEKATALRDIWSSMASAPCNPPSPSTETTPFSTTSSISPIDVLSWLTRATLDAMGLAGFGYNFKSLPSPSLSHPIAPSTPSSQEPEEDELAAAFATIFSSARKLRIMTVLQAWFPILRRFRPDRHVMAHARSVMNRIGGTLIAERTSHVLDEKLNASEKSRSVSKLDRDLLSVMIRSSLAEEPSKRLSQDEALCQISTFLVAGHETTSNALSWALYALAGAPAVQSKLRAELQSLDISLSSGEPSEEDVEAIMRLPYLDAVVREVLRLHAPVTSTMRVCAVESDVVPVSVPFTDKHGREQTSIQLAKGDIISVPLQALNKSVKCWGPDADSFVPERWLSGPPKDVEAIPGLWSHVLTFGNNNFLNGNRSCIGWKFALLEIKLFIFALVRDLEFGIEQGVVIDKRVNVVTRPFVKGKESEGNQMPLLITRAAAPSDLESVPSTPVS